MKAVILAGGEGTRLRPLTSNQPKPMAPIANVPMMEHIVHLLARHGFDDVVVTLAFLADHIRNYFGDGSDYGIRIRYAMEETPLGTAGSVGNAREMLDEMFLVIAGDALTDVDLAAVVRAHRDSSAAATIALKRVQNPVDFGVVITRDDGTIERFVEKPSWGQVFSDTINTNIYVLEPEIFELIPPERSVDFSSDVFPALMAGGDSILGHVIDGYWEDVGTLDAYRRANDDVLRGRVRVEIPGFEVREGVWIGEGAEISPEAVVESPCIVGQDSRIGDAARLGAFTVIGGDVVVRPHADLERTVVHDHAYIGESARLRGTIVGRSSDLRVGVHTESGVVIGDDCLVGAHAAIGADVRVFPSKTIDEGAIVTTSIVFESRGARFQFGPRGVRGLANVDVTPEMVVRLAMAYGSTLKKGAIVTTSRDTSRTARALKRAVIAGLNLTGINVMDLELAPVPLTRFQVRSERAQGGIAVRLAPDDPDSVELRFFDSSGGDINEAAQRKIERQLTRGDFRRAFAGDIGDIWFPPRAIEYYTAALERSVDASRIRARKFKVVLDYSFGAVSQLMPNVLAKLGADVMAVNPFASTSSANEAVADRDERVARIGELVRGSGSDLAMVFAADGETAILLDDMGREIAAERAAVMMTDLVCARVDGATVAVPVRATDHIEAIAATRGGKVVRTRLSTAALLEAARSGSVDLAADGGNGYVWPEFQPVLDAVATLAHLLDLLAASSTSLSSTVDALPVPMVVHERVDTPWDRKGAVMRHLVESESHGELELLDGVKVRRDGGWALVVPDPARPVTNVWAEGPTSDAARRLAAIYVGKVAEIL